MRYKLVKSHNFALCWKATLQYSDYHSSLISSRVLLLCFVSR